jgi:hypothetical protein
MPLTFSYNSGSLSDSIRSIRSQVKDNSTWTQALTLYAAFMLVGAACGWLLVNCVFQYPTNYTDVENVFAGPSAIINGATGLSVTFLFAAFNMQFPHGFGLRGGQAAVGTLCAMTVIGQFLLAGWWDIGSADGSFPVIFGALTLGNIVADLTELIAFPLVATEYGGYLVAPIRAGTDLSGGLVSTFGTFQAPQGGAGPHRFPMSYMQMSFGFLAVIALITWGIIVHTKAGLKIKGQLDTIVEQTEQTEMEAQERNSVVLLEDQAVAPKWWQGFACPRSLVVPVILATLSQFNYWAVGNNSYIIASQMLNAPGHCQDAWGTSALRVAQTVNFWSVPFGSVASSFGRCPRSMFNLLFLVQSTCAIALSLCLFGVGREAFWTTELGRSAYIACYGLVGMLEGYLLTMGYRYCGDDDNVPLELRESSSKLLGVAGIVVVNIPNIFIGILLSDGTIACH